MEAPKTVPMGTEFYGRCFITSHPKSVCDVWVTYAFVAWRENGKVEVHRFPELDELSFSTGEEALSVGFSTARRWTDALKNSGIM